MKKFLSTLSTIKAKIIGLAVAIITMSLIAISIGVTNLQAISDEMNNIVNYEMPFNDTISIIRVHQLEQVIYFEKAMRYAVAGADQKFNVETKAFNKLSAKVDDDIKQINTIVEDALANISNVEYQKEFLRLKEALAKINQEHHDFDKHVAESFDKVRAGDLQGALAMTDSIEQEEKQIDIALSDLAQEVIAFVKHSADNVAKKKTLAITEMIATGIGLFIIGSLMSLFLIRSMVSRLKLAVNNATKIAEGDLTGKIESDGTDEISTVLKSMAVMQGNLRELIGAINQSSEVLASSSQQLSVSSEQTNQSVHEQKSEIDQVATAITQMAATVQEVAKNTVQTSEATKLATNKSENGNQLIKETIKAIETLNQEISHAGDVITELSGETEGIASVLDVIKDIADQTNLLALNAAIEAARAGEQGRGFAVVADEVRTLAQRTQESTSHIQEMIDKLQSGAQKAVEAMNTSQEHASTTVVKIGDTGDALNEISESVNNIASMNAQIASAAEEQSTVAEEISRNIHSVTNNVDMIASASTEVTASAEQLSETANKLQMDVQVFKIA